MARCDLNLESGIKKASTNPTTFGLSSAIICSLHSTSELTCYLDTSPFSITGEAYAKKQLTPYNLHNDISTSLTCSCVSFNIAYTKCTNVKYTACALANACKFIPTKQPINYISFIDYTCLLMILVVAFYTKQQTTCASNFLTSSKRQLWAFVDKCDGHCSLIK